MTVLASDNYATIFASDMSQFGLQMCGYFYFRCVTILASNV